MAPLLAERWINNQQLDIMLDSLGMDSVLRNEVFRELVFLKGMKDAYFTRGIDRINVIKMLDVFYSKTKFANHRAITQNIKTYLQSVSTGGKVSDFILRNVDNQEVKLSFVLDEKPLILGFMRVKDVTCRREMENIHLLYDRLKDSVNVLIVCFDPSLDAMYNFIKNNKVGSRYTFPILHFNQNWEMLNLFHIKDFPTFMLLSKEGTIMENSLMKPSDSERLINTNSDQIINAWQRFIKTK
jgi:thiol-disulfide isomerase/thioredoxin